MKRDYLLALLQNYNPTESEVAFKDRMIQFVRQNPECFERTLSSGHITASCMLLDATGNHALLTHHAKLNRWFQLGGHCDGDSDVLAVALKEAQEESGISDIIPVMPTIFDIDIHLIPANKRDPEHYHYDVRFLLKAQGNGIIKTSNESKELRWIAKNIQALPTQEPSVVRLFKKWNDL